MAQQNIVIGPANQGSGDTLFDAFTKVQANFTELYIDDTGDVNSVNAGTGISVDQTTGAVTVTNDAPNYNHTGEVTGATALTITNGAVTNAKMAANSVDSDQYVDGSIDTVHFSLTAAINTVTDQNTGALKLWSGSQAAYDGLTPDASTIYYLV
jgi:hypothetical protein